MWDLHKTFSHGRISLRRLSMFATASMVALFTVATVLTTPVYAEDVARSSDGTTVTYNAQTYKALTSDQIPPALLTANSSTSGYGYFDTENHKAYLILTSGDSTVANKGQYVVYDFNPPNKYTNGTQAQEVTIKTDGSHSGSVGFSNCNNSETGAIGWIVCPVVTFLAKGMDMIYSFVTNFLEVNTVSNDTHSSLYHMWSLVRDIANLCFVLGFLIIIFSQITNLGLSNYGIKSTLPRLIIAAILVNISFTICAAAVDISNILGHNIHNLFVGIMDKFNTGGQYSNTSKFNMPDWSMITAGILGVPTALIALGITVHNGAIFMLIPMLVGAICAALVALIILAARQALIIILLIISPLAFVAYILPNTEKYFDKWREGFMTLLLLFPIFSVIFSGAQLAGLVIVQNAGGNILTVILGMAVQVAPLFITPLLLKFSGGILNKVAGIVNNPNKGLVDRTRNWANGMAQERKNKVLRDYNRDRGLHRFDPSRRLAVGYGRYQTKVAKRRKLYEAGAENAFNATQQGQNLIAQEKETNNEKQRIDNVFAGSVRGRQLELQSRHLGTQKQEIENSMLDTPAGRHLMHRQQMADVGKTAVENRFNESEHGLQVDTARREADRTKQRISAEHDQAWHFRNVNDQESLEGEMLLRATVDKAAVRKAAVDNAYSELKAGDISNLRFQTDNLRNISQTTRSEAMEGFALAAANVQADSGIQSQYAEEILKANDIQMKFGHHDNKSLRQVATGIGKEHTALSGAAAKYRADLEKESKAQMELMKHYKIDASTVANMSLSKKVDVDGNPLDFSVRDKDGNIQFTFDPTDDFTQDAAIERIAQIGSHDQKVAVVQESGNAIPVYDKNGNPEMNADGTQKTRVGLTYKHRGTVNAIMKDFGAIAPGLRDKSIDLTIQGKFNGADDLHYHTMREVLEGRIKTADIATINPASLKILLMGDDEGGYVHQNALKRLINDSTASEVKRLVKLRKDDPADPELRGLDTDADIQSYAANKIETRMTERRRSIVEMAYTVLTNPNVGRDTTGDSVDLIRQFLSKDDNAAILDTIRTQQRTERRK